jgi:cytochrome c556
MKRIAASVFLAAASAMVVIPQQSLANGPKPEDVVEFRQSVFNVVGWHFGPLGDMAKGDRPYDQQIAIRNTEIIASMSRAAADAFHAGSDVGQTAAKPEIWSKPDEFRTALERFQKEAGMLAEVARNGDFNALRAQIGETGKTCKGCHDEFRKRRR